MPKNYSYDPDDTENNVVMVYVAPEEMKNTNADPLRSELGFVYSILEYKSSKDLSGTELILQPGHISRSDDDMRIQKLSDSPITNYMFMETNSKYIEKMEIMPSNITVLDDKALLPSYRVPVRMYANEATVPDDKFWRVLFTGGSYGDEEFLGLIDTDSIFRKYSFTYANSYTSLYAKSVGIHETCENINSINPVYNSYNLDVRDHQRWCEKLTNPLLIPSYYILETVAYSEEEDIGKGWNVAGGAPNPLRQLSPPLQLYTALSASSSPSSFYEISVHEKLVEISEEVSGERAKSYFEKKYLPLLRETTFSQAQKDTCIHNQRNIILTDSFYRDAVSGLIVPPTMFPYYNVLKWPRHGQGASTFQDGTSVAYSGLHENTSFIRNALALKDADAKFLETLKDIHHGVFPGCRFSNKECFVEYSGIELLDNVDYDTDTNRTVLPKKHRMLDLVNMLQKMYNNPTGSLNDDYTFVGAPHSSYKTTYKDNKLYRYYDNANIISALRRIYEKIRSIYSGWPQPVWGTLSGYDGMISTGEESDYQTDMYASLEETGDILNFLFNCNYSHAETLAYRVEKTGGITTGDYIESKVLQDFWIYNSEEAPQDITLYDTQVKYGEDYTYKVYAYVAVVGTRYRYRDFRLTKQIGTLDAGVDGAGTGARDQAPSVPDGNPEYYCLQFYDPVTGEYADQLFNTGTQSAAGKALSLAYDSYLNLSDADFEGFFRGDSAQSALSQRNRYANDNVDMSEHPQLADFYYDVEPCIKLIEIPLFKKKLKILDSPANDMVAIPFQYMDDSKQIGFNMRYESFNQRRPYPISITKRDRKRSADYQYAYDMLPGEDVQQSSLSPQRYIEVYRTDVKPTSFTDFENRLVDTIDLQIEDSNFTFSDTFYKAQIATNKKYYYVFRFVSENLAPGHMSQILECELVDDGDYIYSKFDVLADQLSEEEIFTETSKSLKKVFQIEPNISQVALNTTKVDFLKPAQDEINNLSIGDPTLEELIWDQTFKIRLTSKKTSKKIDLNVEFKLQEEDRTSAERGTGALMMAEMTGFDFMEQFEYLAGTHFYQAVFLYEEDEDTTTYHPTTRPGIETYYEAYSYTDSDYDLGSQFAVESLSDMMSAQTGEECVIATNAVANGIDGFVDVKARSVEWCIENLHGTWYGEAWRRGYRDWGRKAIRGGPNPKAYEEFRSASDFVTGHNVTLKGAWIFVRRSVQFFLKGLFIKEEGGICR